MDERMRILKLLEEGKITPEEAAKLLEALKEEKMKEEEPSGNVFKMVGNVVSETLGMIPHIIESAFQTAGMGFKAGVVESEFDASEIDKLILKFAGGDVNIKGVESNTIKIKGRGIAKTTKSERTLISKCAGGDIELEVPYKIRLDLSFVGGDIEGTDLGGNIKIRSSGGDVKLSLNEIGDVDIELKGGDAVVKVPDHSFTFEIKADYGEINLPENLTLEERSSNYAKGIYGEKPEGHLCLYCKYGDIELKFKK